jgi:hypothetical protein
MKQKISWDNAQAVALGISCFSLGVSLAALLAVVALR